MRRLIESGAVAGRNFVQVGLRGYWPPPDVLDWMAERGMRSMEMGEIVSRGLGTCLDEAFDLATDDCDGVFLSVDIDVCDPGHAPGTGTPEPGGGDWYRTLRFLRRVFESREVIAAEGYSTFTAENGRRALDVLRTITARRGSCPTPSRSTSSFSKCSANARAWWWW